MNLANRTYQEKRNFIRMRVDAPVTVTTSAGAQLQGTCLNLSGGGMFLSLPEILPVGETLEVALTSHHGHNPMFKARTEISRILAQPNTVSSPCHVGLRILEVLE